MQKNQILGTAKIESLLIKFSIPSIISMIVSALYNIVDQIFIGNSVGILGNAATNVAFPLTTICTALGLLCGIGGSAAFNISMGKKDSKKAKEFVLNCILMLVIFGLLLTISVIVFLKPILIFFGATIDVLQYSLIYTKITSIGFVFLILTTGGTALIRADSSPTYSMICMLSGAIINTFLDALFIFKFNMGMQGAAYATIIGQFISALMVLSYFKNFKAFKIKLSDFKLSLSSVKSILFIGLAPFTNQIAIMIVQIVMNNTLTFYGSSSTYGSEIPLAVVGIISKISFFPIAFVIGIAQGLQPIVSYNYGAKNFDRVKETYKKAIPMSFLVSTLFFICFQAFPRQIIQIFGSADVEYYNFAEMYFHIYLFFTFLNGIQPITANFFTSMGKNKQGIFLSLTRQTIFFLPLIYILPKFLGIDGILYTAPIADFAAAIVAIIFIKTEFKNMEILKLKYKKIL